MAEVQIQLTNDRSKYAPNDILEGKVCWNVGQARSAILRFFWRTEGQGTTDIGLHEELSFNEPQSVDSRAFRFKVPAGPWTYDGKLVAIRWTLELQVEPGNVASLDVVVSPQSVDREALLTSKLS